MTALERIEILAAATHQAWYCLAVLGHHERGFNWTTAPEWQKSVIYHTVAFWESLDFTPCKLSQLAAITHQVWIKHMTKNGWRYGAVLSLEARTDPDLVSFSVLPDTEKEKDYAVIETYLAMRAVLGEPVRNL